MRDDNLLLMVAVAAVIVSMVAAGFTYLSVSSLVTRISGYATSTGQANITVESHALANFTTNYVSWGSGRVSVGQTFAVLNTMETNNVTNGNWTLNTNGFRIENNGNVNVSIDLLAGKSAAQFIGGTNPGYQWNVSNVEAMSCLNSTGGNMSSSGFGTWATVNNTNPGTRMCDRLFFSDSNDLIRIDLNLSIPYDSSQGALTDTLTATATSV